MLSARVWTGALTQALLALLYAGGGIVVLVNAAVGLTTLTLVLAVVFVTNGVLKSSWTSNSARDRTGGGRN